MGYEPLILRELNKKISKPFLPYSLRNRLILSLVLSSIIPVVVIGLISYTYIHSINVNKVQEGIQSNVNWLKETTDDELNELNYISLQILYSSSMVENIERFFATDRMFEKVEIVNTIDENLGLINFANQNIDYSFYYFDEQRKILSKSKDLDNDFEEEGRLPLFRQNEIAFYSPHKSQFQYEEKSVVSIIRTLKVHGDITAYLYIESAYSKLDGMAAGEYGMHAVNFIVNGDGLILYSEDENNFPPGTTYTPTGKTDESFESHGGYYVFKSPERNGWRVFAAVGKDEYNREIDKWLSWLILLGSMFLALGLFFALMIWRSVYTPIRGFASYIQQITNDQYDSNVGMSHIKEFDELSVMFQQMAERIKYLLNEIKRKEKLRRYFEVERLLYQINPHFLHNTLDTLRWMARMNGQDDIDRLATSLNKVLHYNLERLGESATVREEIDVLTDYVAIQKMRLDNPFTVQFDVEPSLQDIKIPRFLLQPLVENSLFHGLKADMNINVSLRRSGVYIVATVSDNGRGMSSEVLRQAIDLTRDVEYKKGMGIGLSYVFSMVKVYYGEDATISIESSPGRGTTVELRVPVDMPPQDIVGQAVPTGVSGGDAQQEKTE